MTRIACAPFLGWSLRWAIVAGLLLVLPAGASRAADSDKKTESSYQMLPPEKALKKARGGGKYAMLLRQFNVPADAGQYADFRDAGLREPQEYAGHKNLPRGYWVYVYPSWYIWRDRTSVLKLKRPWGPEQATGEPDTKEAGDVQTAWASLTPDGHDEWLLLEYAEPVAAEAVLVYETFNPGAVNRVTAFRLDGEEVEVWKGKDPTPITSAKGISEITFPAGFKTNRIRVHVRSTAVPGWNEIDAVGLRDTSGKVHWATAAEASSTYADQAGVGAGIGGGIIFLAAPAMAPAPPVFIQAAPIRLAVPAPAPAKAKETPEQRLRQVEREKRQLKETLKKLEQEETKLKEQLKEQMKERKEKKP